MAKCTGGERLKNGTGYWAYVLNGTDIDVK